MLMLTHSLACVMLPEHVVRVGPPPPMAKAPEGHVVWPTNTSLSTHAGIILFLRTLQKCSFHILVTPSIAKEPIDQRCSSYCNYCLMRTTLQLAAPSEYCYWKFLAPWLAVKCSPGVALALAKLYIYMYWNGEVFHELSYGTVQSLRRDHNFPHATLVPVCRGQCCHLRSRDTFFFTNGWFIYKLI